MPAMITSSRWLFSRITPEFRGVLTIASEELGDTDRLL